MANLSIRHDDLIATLQAQRNEAWDAAARAGAACGAAGREIDALQKELEAAHKQIEDGRIKASDIPQPPPEVA